MSDKKASVIIFMSLEDGKIMTRLSPEIYSPFEWGMLLVDIARHVANAKDIDVDEVYEGFDAERKKNTTDIKAI